MALNATASGGRAPYTYAWDVNNDGQYELGGSSASYSFPDNGTYTVRVKVTDSAGTSAAATAQVTVSNASPRAAIDCPSTGMPGMSITFSGSATDPSTADTAAGFQYRWDFGDGQTSNQGITTHVYNTAGAYDVALTVTDKDGGSTQAAATITITVSAIIEAKVFRNEVGSGECLISSGFPLPQGLVPEQLIRDGKIRILVNGAEVPANVSALRGRHYDGTLRSMLIQFNYSLSQNDEIAAQVVIDGGVRQYPDPQYQRPTLDIISHNNIIAPSSPAYLVSTNLTLRQLLPEGAGSAAEEQLYTALASDRFDALSINENDGTASYENVSAMLGMWARSAENKYQQEALKKTLEWLPYNTPAANQSPPCRCDVIINPDSREGGQGCGTYAEWYMPRVLSYAQMYLLTGYRDFWSLVAYYAQDEQSSITSQALAYTSITSGGVPLGNWDTPRFNYAARYGALLAALMIDATIPVNGQWFSGRAFNWTNQLQWTIDALQYNAWDLKWIPFDSGSGIVPANGTTISQGSVTATLLGVYELMHDPITLAGATMPTTGYLQVNNISGGSFTSGVLGGISANALGPQLSDYRQGMTGTRSNSPRVGTIPTFQLVFVTNFLIDTYLYVQRDSRIPAMVKVNLDIILNNIRLQVPGDPDYGFNGGVWGNPLYCKPYTLEQPVANDTPAPYELPEYARIVAFVLKTNGDATVNGASYSTWYQRLINTGNISPVMVLIWQWKLFGQFYGWGLDAPWMMAQSSLVNYGPATMRTPTQWNSIPGDMPDIAREL